MAKIRLQNFICFAFQIRGTTLCPSTEIKWNFSFSNGNSFLLGKHEWLDLKPGIFKYAVSKNSTCDLAVGQTIDHEIEVSSSTGKERHIQPMIQSYIEQTKIWKHCIANSYWVYPGNRADRLPVRIHN